MFNVHKLRRHYGLLRPLRGELGRVLNLPSSHNESQRVMRMGVKYFRVAPLPLKAGPAPHSNPTNR
eukprot:scaffold248504_cov53-Cyclotella_meneghiniana.AAC.2